MCLPSHCLYFPLLGGSNLINSFTLKGSANDCECVELAVRPNPPKLHGWERKTSRCLKKKIGSYQEGEWLLRKLIKTNTLSDLFYHGNPLFFFFHVSGTNLSWVFCHCSWEAALLSWREHSVELGDGGSGSHGSLMNWMTLGSVILLLWFWFSFFVKWVWI